MKKNKTLKRLARMNTRNSKASVYDDISDNKLFRGFVYAHTGVAPDRTKSPRDVEKMVAKILVEEGVILNAHETSKWVPLFKGYITHKLNMKLGKVYLDMETPKIPTDDEILVYLNGITDRKSEKNVIPEKIIRKELFPNHMGQFLVENVDVRSDEFLKTYEWRKLRMKIIKKYGTVCQCCGATPHKNNIVINVDHIKPRKTSPHLALSEDNLQVLCNQCNHGKGNWDDTDWRN